MKVQFGGFEAGVVARPGSLDATTIEWIQGGGSVQAVTEAAARALVFVLETCLREIEYRRVVRSVMAESGQQPGSLQVAAEVHEALNLTGGLTPDDHDPCESWIARPEYEALLRLRDVVACAVRGGA